MGGFQQLGFLPSFEEIVKQAEQASVTPAVLVRRQGEHPVSVEQNKAVARRWNKEVLNDRRFEALGEVLAKNYVHYNASDPLWSPGVQGLDHAKEQAKESLEGGWFAQHPTWRVSVDDIIGEGDKVAARLTAYEEGKPVTHSIVFYRLTDGKIVDDWYCSTQIQD